MTDFSLIVGTHKTIVPKAMDKQGNLIGFPEGSVFHWISSDSSVIEVSDAEAPSPEIVATSPGIVTITGMLDEHGFHHEASHTVEAIAAPEDTIVGFDFDIV